MDIKRYRQVRVVVALFVGAMVAVAAAQDIQILAIIGIVTGMIFMILVRRKTRVIVDERERAIGEKAARLTYAIFTPTIGLGSFILVTLGRNTLYLFSLGQILAYLTLFSIALYSISYYFLNRKYGGK